MGGLGNQMFQYAAGKALAHKLHATLKLDISQYQNEKLRKYALDCFELKAEFATGNDLKKFFSYKQKPFWYKNLLRFIILEENPVPSFITDYFTVKGNIFLNGYWQSEKYFLQITPIIKDEFNFRIKVMNSYKRKIMQTNSVAIHIRRGDYISNKITKEFHGICSNEYYANSIEYIHYKIKSPFFFIFSDDLDWCRKKFVDILKSNDYLFVESTTDIIDLQLMSLCKHNIIANSSFSWWASWLNNNRDKIVIAPQIWINPDSYWAKKWKLSTDFIIPDTWIKI